jgi:hypothetical protein
VRSVNYFPQLLVRGDHDSAIEAGFGPRADGGGTAGAAPVFTLGFAPTKRCRHALTETPPVEAALAELRRELGTESVEPGELVVLGAAAKLVSIRAERDSDARLRRRLADRIRSRSLPVDVDAAELARRTGWARG